MKVQAFVRLPLRVVASAMVNEWDSVFDISPFTVEFSEVRVPLFDISPFTVEFSKERVLRFVRFPVKVIFLRVVVPLFV